MIQLVKLMETKNNQVTVNQKVRNDLDTKNGRFLKRRIHKMWQDQVWLKLVLEIAFVILSGYFYGHANKALCCLVVIRIWFDDLQEKSSAVWSNKHV